MGVGRRQNRGTEFDPRRGGIASKTKAEEREVDVSGANT